MGRAGAGGGGGGMRSGGFSGGGHFSSSHSGGGHTPSFGSSSSSRSSRAGSSRNRSASFNTGTSGTSFGGGTTLGSGMFSSRRSVSPPIIINNGSGAGRRVAVGNGCGTGCGTIVIILVVIVILMVVASMLISQPDHVQTVEYSSVPASSYNREKLTDSSWTNNCVVDETGWISEDGSVAGLERKLREFYDKTGVQPYVYLVGYRPELFTVMNKEDFASEYYENEIGNDYTFAFFYFEEQNPDDVGYMYYEGGSAALGVMDSEAVEIFWSICDQEWYSDATTEDCIANIFNRTADRIMTKTATKYDIVKIVLIIVAIIVLAAVIIIIMNKRRKQEKERNEETRKILETPLE